MTDESSPPASEADPLPSSEDDPLPVSEDHRFFRAVEETFVRLRGAPMLLAAPDWQLVRDWHREEIPLELIVSTLEDVFERRRLRGSPEKIQGLRYCKNAVEAAWAEVKALSSPEGRTEVERLDCDGRLNRLAATLPSSLERAESWRERILALQGVEHTLGPRAVEQKLFELDRELIEGAERGLSADVRRRLETSVDQALAPLKKQGGADLELARRRLLVQKVRRELSIPMLSLFSPEASEE